MSQKITPNLWFDMNAEEAANFYVDLFDDGRILNVARYPEGKQRSALLPKNSTPKTSTALPPLCSAQGLS